MYSLLSASDRLHGCEERSRGDHQRWRLPLQYQIFTAILILREIQACWLQISAECVTFSLLRIAMCEAVKPAFLWKVRYSLVVVKSTQIKYLNCNLLYCSAGQSYPSAKIDGFIDDNKVEFL